MAFLSAVNMHADRSAVRQGGHKPGKLEYSGISLNMENSWNFHGILCNLKEKL